MNTNEQIIKFFDQTFHDSKFQSTLEKMNQDFFQDNDHFKRLYDKWMAYYHESMTLHEAIEIFILVSDEMISVEEPQWEMIAGRFLAFDIHQQVESHIQKLHLLTFYDKIKYLTQEGYYGAYILEHYNKQDIQELETYIDDERDELFNHSGLDLLYKRYLIHDYHHQILETPQEMFMGIAMHLAIKEKKRVQWAKQFYDVLSTLKITMATPTMANARKPFKFLNMVEVWAYILEKSVQMEALFVAIRELLEELYAG